MIINPRPDSEFFSRICLPPGRPDAIEHSVGMENQPSKTLFYKRSHFVTHLPLTYLYSPSHYWLAESNGVWRVGFTKFATRMLGEIVDHQFTTESGTSVRTGEVVGWIEGFKAISDIYCVVEGEFRSANVRLKEDLEAIDRDCYHSGWLFEAVGKPDPLCTDAEGYKALLDKTIEKLLEKQGLAG